MGRNHQVFVSMKQVIAAVDERNSDLTYCLPSLNGDDEERKFHLKKLAKSQQEIDSAIQKFRDATDSRFTDYSNAEILFVVHLWANIWGDSFTPRLASQDILDIIGHNRIREAGDFIASAIDGSSKLLRFLKLEWLPGGDGKAGEYSFTVSDPDAFNRLVLGEIPKQNAE